MCGCFIYYAEDEELAKEIRRGFGRARCYQVAAGYEFQARKISRSRLRQCNVPTTVLHVITLLILICLLFA